MATTTPLTLMVDPETAGAFAATSPEDQRKLQILLNLRLRELLEARDVSLGEILDRVGRAAEARGLTPEILESILHDY